MGRNVCFVVGVPSRLLLGEDFPAFDADFENPAA